MIELLQKFAGCGAEPHGLKGGGAAIKTYAYCRVSTAEQNEGRQIDSVAKMKIPRQHVFIDKVSGHNFERPQWKRLMDELEEGDLLYVVSIDRLGRNYEDILEQWRVLTKEKSVDIAVIDMPLLDTRRGKDLMGTFLADIVLALLSYVAEKEKENIHQRQREGIAAAKARGVRFGRPAKKLPRNFAKVVKQWESGDILFRDALKRTGMKESTFYNRLRKFRAERKKKENRRILG